MEEKLIFCSTGEMAKLFGLDRSSLHYYDKTGMVTPKKRENGYRYYTIEDFLFLMATRHLKSMGLRLEDIQESLCSRDAAATDRLFEDQLGSIEKQIRWLEQVEYVLKRTKKIYSYAASYSGGYEIAEHVEFYHLPVLSAYPGVVTVRDREKLAVSVEHMPLVSYCLFFPPGALNEREAFCYDIGLSFSKRRLDEYALQLPEETCHYPEQRTVQLMMYFTKQQLERLSYDDFAEIREVAGRDGIDLTGGAMGYPIFVENGRVEGDKSVGIFMMFFCK